MKASRSLAIKNNINAWLFLV
ncbi:MAG: hypothetical protein K0Q59_5760, partial [Paenibacillus sp.]|nr:hypothetical protein [Paenibacillus sp.]